MYGNVELCWMRVVNEDEEMFAKQFPSSKKKII